MRKKQLLEEIERLREIGREGFDRKEVKKEKLEAKRLKDIQPMKTHFCKLCGARRLEKDMSKYKERDGYNNGWVLYYACKKCPESKLIIRDSE